MQDDVPSHLSKFTQEFFEDKRFTWEKIMEWPAIKSWAESIQKSMVICEDEIIWNWQT